MEEPTSGRVACRTWTANWDNNDMLCISLSLSLSLSRVPRECDTFSQWWQMCVSHQGILLFKDFRSERTVVRLVKTMYSSIASESFDYVISVSDKAVFR